MSLASIGIAAAVYAVLGVFCVGLVVVAVAPPTIAGTALIGAIPMALAAAAFGADGLLVEVHEDPAVALSDGAQSLYPDQFVALMAALGPVVRAVGRQM